MTNPWGPPHTFKVLGWDDWLIYARRDDGVLCYTVLECCPDWLDAPHGGMHDCTCEPSTMAVCKIDSTWLFERVKRHPSHYGWTPSIWEFNDEMPDDEWARQSAEHYLTYP